MTAPAWRMSEGGTPWYAVVTAPSVVTSAILSAHSVSVVVVAEALGRVLSRPRANFTLSEGLFGLGGPLPFARESPPAQRSPSRSALNQGPSPAPTTADPLS